MPLLMKQTCQMSSMSSGDCTTCQSTTTVDSKIFNVASQSAVINVASRSAVINVASRSAVINVAANKGRHGFLSLYQAQPHFLPWPAVGSQTAAAFIHYYIGPGFAVNSTI
jgi:hypothetical protein